MVLGHHERHDRLAPLRIRNAHDCHIGNHTIFANAATLGGHVTVEDWATIGAFSGVHQFCRIGEGVMVAGHASITRDVAPFLMVAERDDVIGLNAVGLKRRGFSRAAIAELKSAYHAVFFTPGNIRDVAAAQLAASWESAEARRFLEFFAAGKRSDALALLGAARLEIGKRCNLINQGAWEFLWVVDAPMFERTDAGGWTAVHHPFTGPKPEFESNFDQDPGNALAYAYDIVLNGNEIGGGSIRIHRRDIQQRVFDVIGLTREEAESKFGFLLEAFNYGPPPHGGIALGMDRLVALLARAESIREVIAFPKTASGGDPLTGAPTPITSAQRREAGIDAPLEAKKQS